MARVKASIPLIFVGLILFFFGSALDLTILGAPPGVTAQIFGVVLMAYGAGFRL